MTRTASARRAAYRPWLSSTCEQRDGHGPRAPTSAAAECHVGGEHGTPTQRRRGRIRGRDGARVQLRECRASAKSEGVGVDVSGLVDEKLAAVATSCTNVAGQCWAERASRLVASRGATYCKRTPRVRRVKSGRGVDYTRECGRVRAVVNARAYEGLLAA
jgi:hypothetical protein